MKVLATKEEKAILRKYMSNADYYLDKNLTNEEYRNFELDLTSAMISWFDKDGEPTKTGYLLEKIYDLIYSREDDWVEE